jgi:hypothetical protein
MMDGSFGLGPSPGARIYSYRGWAVFQIFGIVLFVGLAVACLVGFLLHGGLGLLIPGLVMLGLSSIVAFQLPYLLTRVAVDEQGLWNLIPGRRPICLRWGDISSLEAHDERQRLIVKDAAGTTAIRIEYQAPGFDILRKEILEKAKNLASPRRRVFEFSKRTVAIPLLVWIALPLSLGSLLAVTPHDARTILLPGLLAVPCAIGAILWFLSTRQRLEIRDRELVVRRGRSNTVIPFSEVEDVEIVTVPGPKGSLAEKVRLRVRGPSLVELPTFYKSEQVYEAVRAAWLAARG